MENKNNKQRDLVPYIIILVVIVLLRTYIITPIIVNGSSMDPTLKDNDIMILNKIGYKFFDIKRFDIVVVKESNEKLIKRIIGLPGDKVTIKNNKLYINDKYVEQDFLSKDIEDTDFTSDVIPDNCYFVMGDNRDDSLDSRVLGCFSKDDIIGKASLVIFPFNRSGVKK